EWCREGSAGAHEIDALRVRVRRVALTSGADGASEKDGRAAPSDRLTRTRSLVHEMPYDRILRRFKLYFGDATMTAAAARRCRVLRGSISLLRSTGGRWLRAAGSWGSGPEEPGGYSFLASPAVDATKAATLTRPRGSPSGVEDQKVREGRPDSAAGGVAVGVVWRSIVSPQEGGRAPALRPMGAAAPAAARARPPQTRRGQGAFRGGEAPRAWAGARPT